MSAVETFADQAVFVLQFNTKEAVRYVQHNAHVSEQVATAAVKRTATFHRK